jgi:iron complex outermembrane receptor protein
LYRRELKTKAIYTQFAFDISPATTLSVGGRYTKDSGHYIASNRTFLGAAGLPTAGQFDSGPCSAGLATYDNFNATACTGEQSLESSSPSWTVTVDHRLSDKTMIYGTTRRGYIAGGFNNQAFSPATTGIARTFNPEKVTDLEFGLKSDWELGGRPIRTNLAAVFGKYKDQQRVQNGTTATGTTFTGVVNAGKSKYWALDLDAVYKATDHLDLTLGWNHINSEYTEFNAIVAIPGVFAFVDLKGKEMSQTPKNVINAAVTVHWPAADSVGEISSTLSGYHRSDTLSKDSPTFGGTTNASGLVVSIDPAQDFRQYDVLHGFTQLNFTTSWKQMFGSKFDAQLSVKNLTDELYELAASNQMLQFGYANYYYGNPREYSVSLRYSF